MPIPTLRDANDTTKMTTNRLTQYTVGAIVLEQQRHKGLWSADDCRQSPIHANDQNMNASKYFVLNDSNERRCLVQGDNNVQSIDYWLGILSNKENEKIVVLMVLLIIPTIDKPTRRLLRPGRYFRMTKNMSIVASDQN